MTPKVGLTDASSIGKFKGVATVVLVLAVIIIAFLILNKVFKLGSGVFTMFGLQDSKEEQAYEQKIANTVKNNTTAGAVSRWSPTYYKQYGTTSNMLSIKDADRIASNFWDSVGYVWDTPSEGLAAVKQVTNATQLSQVVAAFYAEHELDLLGWLQNKYDTEEQKRILVQILNYAANLPK